MQGDDPHPRWGDFSDSPPAVGEIPKKKSFLIPHSISPDPNFSVGGVLGALFTVFHMFLDTFSAQGAFLDFLGPFSCPERVF